MSDRNAAVDASWAHETEAGPLVRLRLSLTRWPWRIGPGWAVLAGAVAGNVVTVSAEMVLRLAAAVALADVAWGMLRSYVVAPGHPDARHGALPPLAPYSQPDAPLTRWLLRLAANRAHGTSDLRSVWQEFLAGGLMVGAISVLLGPTALVLSLLALGTMWLAAALYRRDAYPAACLAVLDVGLPWLLGMALVRPDVALIEVSAYSAGLILAGAFVVLQWGVYRATRAAAPGGWWLWLGELSVLVALIVLHQAWATAVVAILFAPPTWWFAGGGRRRALDAWPWWWAAMVIAAILV